MFMKDRLHFQLSVRGKNAKEQITGFFKNLTKTADEVLLSNQKVTFFYSSNSVTRRKFFIDRFFVAGDR